MCKDPQKLTYITFQLLLAVFLLVVSIRVTGITQMGQGRLAV